MAKRKRPRRGKRRRNVAKTGRRPVQRQQSRATTKSTGHSIQDETASSLRAAPETEGWTDIESPESVIASGGRPSPAKPAGDNSFAGILERVATGDLSIRWRGFLLLFVIAMLCVVLYMGMQDNSEGRLNTVSGLLWLGVKSCVVILLGLMAISVIVVFDAQLPVWFRILCGLVILVFVVVVMLLIGQVPDLWNASQSKDGQPTSRATGFRISHQCPSHVA